MPEHRTLTYRNIAQAEAFVREAQDENAETIAVDNAEFYCTKVHGIHRAPLPPIVDRGAVSFRDAEDALIARIDGEAVTEDDEELLADEELDHEIELAFAETSPMTLDEAGESFLEQEAWLMSICRAADDFASGTVRPRASDKVVVIRHRLAARSREAFLDVEPPPAVISCRRDVLATEPLGTLDRDARKVVTWKDTTTNGRQFQRHA